MTTLRKVRYTYNEVIADTDIVWTFQLYHCYAQIDWSANFTCRLSASAVE